MDDREKVIRGLQESAAYFRSSFDAMYGTVACEKFRNWTDAIEQAIALLKALEPRVMTYDELATFDGAFLIESSAISSQLGWVFFFDTDTKSDAIWVEGFDGERSVVYREDYGKYTRCWTSRPDEKRRAETPWN